MIRRTWLYLGLLAGALGLALLAWYAPPRAPAVDVPLAQEFEALKRIPTIDVVREEAEGMLMPLMLRNPKERDAVLQQINALDPDVQALMWLSWLNDQWGRDGLHTFFFRDGGDHAPAVLAALRHAGLDREATVFAEAMALFGPNYPTDQAARERAFAWSRPGRRIDAYTTQPNEPNAFDRVLMRKAEEFGTQDSLAQRIAAYVESTPAARAWSERTRAHMSDEERLDWLLDRLAAMAQSASGADLSTWPRAYRQLRLMAELNAEQLNGGVHQYFYNSSGDAAPETVAVLKEAGLPRHAAALQRSVDLFGTPYPTDTQARRESHFHKPWSDWDEKLNAATDDIDDGGLHEKMLEIAQLEHLLPR